MKAISYQDSGVSIDQGNAFVDRIKPFIQKTKRPEVLAPLGGFAGLFSLNSRKYEDPVLVSSTDGVGTKLKIAQEMKQYKGLGVDLVAMCVNDILCVGAEPLFFLDYYACGKLDIDSAAQIIEGMSESLASIQCALIGGETAEMPGVYSSSEFDLAGFAVGIVNRPDIIDGSTISIGNAIIGIASSGVHANGFSLVRKIIESRNLDLQQTYPGLEKSLGATLVEPTRVYVNPVLHIKKQFPILGLAHITGGGLLENIPRVLPQGTKARLYQPAWPLLPIFELLQAQGNVETPEMHRVFNCGIGMVMVVRAEQAEEIVQRLQGMGEQAYIIGEVAAKHQADEASVEILN